MLEQAGLDDEVELDVTEGEIRIRPIRAPRADWATAAAQLVEREGGGLLDPVTNTDFDNTWEW